MPLLTAHCSLLTAHCSLLTARARERPVLMRSSAETRRHLASRPAVLSAARACFANVQGFAREFLQPSFDIQKDQATLQGLRTARMSDSWSMLSNVPGDFRDAVNVSAGLMPPGAAEFDGGVSVGFTVQALAPPGRKSKSLIGQVT